MTPPPMRWLGRAWSVVDSTYFTVMTITTVGYGDFGPSRPGVKLFTAFFALFGVMLGLGRTAALYCRSSALYQIH